MHGSKTFLRSIGRSVEGREQIVHSNFDLAILASQPTCTLLIGGMHGDEIATVSVNYFLISHIISVSTTLMMRHVTSGKWKLKFPRE